MVVNTAIVYIVDAFESGILVLKSAKLDSEDQDNATSGNYINLVHIMLIFVYRTEESSSNQIK